MFMDLFFPLWIVGYFFVNKMYESICFFVGLYKTHFALLCFIVV